MFTNVNEQFTIGTRAERMPINPADVPNGLVYYERDTKEAVIALDGSWEPFASGVLAAAAFGHATILTGQDHVDVSVPGLTVAADILVSIVGTSVDATVKGVQAGVTAPGTLRILSTSGNAAADVKVAYFIPSVV